LGGHNKASHKLFTSPYSSQVVLAITVVAIVTMMFDVSLARVYDLIEKQPTSLWRVAIFVFIIAVLIVTMFLIIKYIGEKTADIRGISKLHIGIVHRAIWAAQTIITAILVTIAVQIILVHHYDTFLLIATVCISYGLAMGLLGLLAQRFFSWFLSSKNFVIIMYMLAAASLAVNAGFTLFYVNDVLLDRPKIMMPYSAGSIVSILPYTERAVLNSGFFVSSIVSFALLWSATAVLLHHYASKVGKLRFWATIASPLILFLGQFASYFGAVLDPLLSLDPVSNTMFVTLVFTLSKPIGGILFGIAFFTLARNFRQNAAIRNYLVISALGFVLLYVSNQASVLVVTPFPAFGAPTVAFMALASYLILLGIYSSAISISEDAKLRHMLRRTAFDESKLLDSVGTAYMKDEIQRKVLKIRKANLDKMIEVTGLDTVPSESDMKQYIEEVIKEMQANKEKR
jgi:hypothetical protein